MFTWFVYTQFVAIINCYIWSYGFINDGGRHLRTLFH